MKVNGKDYLIYYGKKNVPNHQPVHSGIPKVELTWENVIDHIVDIKWIFMAQANEEHADMIGI